MNNKSPTPAPSTAERVRIARSEACKARMQAATAIREWFRLSERWQGLANVVLWILIALLMPFVGAIRPTEWSSKSDR